MGVRISPPVLKKVQRSKFKVDSGQNFKLKNFKL